MWIGYGTGYVHLRAGTVPWRIVTLVVLPKKA